MLDAVPDHSTDHPAHDPADDRLHPLLRTRWSPMSFDANHRSTRDETELLLEAARWAPSAGNSQPWAFIVGCRGDDTHQRPVPRTPPGPRPPLAGRDPLTSTAPRNVRRNAKRPKNRAL